MDRIDMDPDTTTDAMNLMDRTSQYLSTDWGATSSRLSLLAGQLGGGELGAAYLSGYQQPAAETVTAVEHQCQQPGRLAAMGHQCVGLYRSTDQSIGDTFNSLGATTLPTDPTAA